MNEDSNLSIIIINYNTTNEIENCLNSINEKLSHLYHEVIVVDNYSYDRAIEKISQKLLSTRFIFLKENIGFSKANNLAAQKSNSEYLLFLNPDTLFIEDCIVPIIKFIQENRKVGACGPMLLNPDYSYQNSTGPQMGLIYEFLEAFLLINIYRKLYKLLYKKFNSFQSFPVGWVGGAFMLIKKEVFMEVNGFDESFFLNYEDIDLCKRLKAKGYSNYYFPALKCIHSGLGSQSKDYENLVYSRYQSRLIYSNKHYNFFLRYIIRLLHILGLMLRMILNNFLYSGLEKKQRYLGYKKSLKLYLGIKVN